MQKISEFAPRWRECSVNRNFLLLGRIVDNLDWDLSACKAMIPPGESYREYRYADQWATWELYDATYGWRSDYRVFRLATRQPYFSKRHLIVPPGATEASLMWRLPVVEVQQALDKVADPRIVWGVISSIPDLVSQALERQAGAKLEAVVAAAETALKRLESQDLRPLVDCRANCGLSAARLTISFHELSQKLDGNFSKEWFTGWLADLGDYRGWIDSESIPGRRLRTHMLSLEQREGPRLRPTEANDDLENLIFIHRYELQAITKYVEGTGHLDDDLLSRALDAAKTAWYHARTRRITEEMFQKKAENFESGRSRVLRRRLFLAEAELLVEAAGAAKNAGEHLEEAQLLHLFCALIPPELRKDHAVPELLRKHWQAFRRIREAGLQVLAFRDDELSSRDHDTKSLSDIVEFSRNKANVLAHPSNDPESVFEQILARDIESSPDWKIITQRWPRPVLWRREHYLRNLLRIFADGDGLTLSEHEFGALFSIACHYGYVRSAAKLLSKFSPRISQILRFVHHLKRCAQTTPFGWRVEKLEEWRQLLLRLLVAGHLGSRPIDGLTPPERLLVHEVVMGLASAHLRRLPRPIAHKLYETWQGTIEVDDLHQLYDRELHFDRKGPGAIEGDRLASFARRVGGDSSATPTHVSILTIGDGVSVVAVGALGTVHGSFVPLPELEADIVVTREHAPMWFLNASEPFELQVSWSDSLIDLAHSVLRAANQVQEGGQTLVLAVPSSLAALPLQHLFLSVLSERPAHERGKVVSLVPNLGALPLGWRSAEQNVHRGLVWLSDEQDECIPPVVASIAAAGISSTLFPLPVSVVVAHGSIDLSGVGPTLPSVRLGTGPNALEDASEWKDVIQPGGIAMINACSTGTMGAPQFLGGFGALPQLALGLGCRLLLAPVKEVDPSTAITLIEALFGTGKRSDASIGALYLSAIEKDPAVCLYNLYGLSSIALGAAKENKVVPITGGSYVQHIAQAS